ncbi:hypothetical protein ESCO_005215 [Escovopsis weberi]|uniref:Acid phosphatase-like protein n=1 Tax=Escovopsis weberi TaxID=150374 RepID=A0A0M9VW38_ESCWE|nr:hypothetical protein ESCO_005215 [Escovopsis weberi]
MVSTTGAIVIIVVVLLVAAAIGWVVFANLRARRLGLPAPSLSSYLPWRKSAPPYGPPQPARGGIIGWFNDQVEKFKHRNNRSAAGAYEPRGRDAGGRGGRGFGPLDPDDAWDARVGHEADAYGYYEEQELGGTTTEYRGAAGAFGIDGNGGGGGEGRGRQMDRAAPPPLAHPTGAHELAHVGVNPFDDDVEADLRGVSPRPMAGAGAGAGAGSSKPERPHSAGSSLGERKSIFREEV